MKDEQRKERPGLPMLDYSWLLMMNDDSVFYQEIANFKNVCPCIKSECTGNFITRDNNLMLIYFAQIIININKSLILWLFYLTRYAIFRS